MPPRAQDPLEARIARALERSRPVLRTHLQAGSGGELALVCLAALHDGLEHDDEDLTAAIGRLAALETDHTYTLAVRLMVMADLAAYPDRRLAARRDATALLRNLGPHGFSYTSRQGSTDLSNTQYGALGLRAAAALGVPMPRTVWQRLATAVLRAQGRGGGFGYPLGGGATDDDAAYPSMTVAGIAILEICRQQLANTGTAELQRAVHRAWQWMDGHAAAVGDPAARWTYYFHYGLERAAVLSGVDEVGGADWYRRGAEMLLALQRKDGTWNGAGRRQADTSGAVDTAFAVLFLRRRFARVLQPHTLSGYNLGHLPAQATAADVAQAIANEVAHGLAAVEGLIGQLHSPLHVRRMAAVRALEAITSRDFGFAGADPLEVPERVRFAEQWWLTEGRRRWAVERKSDGEE